MVARVFEPGDGEVKTVPLQLREVLLEAELEGERSSLREAGIEPAQEILGWDDVRGENRLHRPAAAQVPEEAAQCLLSGAAGAGTCWCRR